MMKKLAILLALVPLSGCIKFGSEPPPSLLTLTPAAQVPVGQTRSSGSATSITIQVPSAPQELATTRVPVRSSAITVAYVKDAAWVEQPTQMFARLLADTITARTNKVVLSGRQSLVDPGIQLTGELAAFSLDATTNEAIVVYDAAILREGATAFEKRRFEARVPVTEIAAGPAGTALNQAANQVAADVADWVDGK